MEGREEGTAARHAAREAKARELLLRAGVTEAQLEQYVRDLKDLVNAGLDDYFAGLDAKATRREGPGS